MKKPADGITAEEFWDDTYRARDQIWSGNPNPVLVELIGGPEPGSALDLDAARAPTRSGWRATAGT